MNILERWAHWKTQTFWKLDIFDTLKTLSVRYINMFKYVSRNVLIHSGGMVHNQILVKIKLHEIYTVIILGYHHSLDSCCGISMILWNGLYTWTCMDMLLAMTIIIHLEHCFVIQ